MPAVRRPRAALAALLLAGRRSGSWPGCAALRRGRPQAPGRRPRPATPTATPLAAFDTDGLTRARARTSATGSPPADASAGAWAPRWPAPRRTATATGRARAAACATSPTSSAAPGRPPTAPAPGPGSSRPRSRRRRARRARRRPRPRERAAAPVPGAPRVRRPDGRPVRCRDGGRQRAVFSGLVRRRLALLRARRSAGGAACGRTGRPDRSVVRRRVGAGGVRGVLSGHGSWRRTGRRRSVLVGLLGAAAPADAGLEEAVEVAVEDRRRVAAS